MRVLRSGFSTDTAKEPSVFELLTHPRSFSVGNLTLDIWAHLLEVRACNTLLGLLAGKVQSGVGFHALVDKPLLLLLQTQISQVAQGWGFHLIHSAVAALDGFCGTAIHIRALSQLLQSGCASCFWYRVELRLDCGHKLRAQHFVFGRQGAGHVHALKHAFALRCPSCSHDGGTELVPHWVGCFNIWFTTSGLQRHEPKGFCPLSCFVFCGFGEGNKFHFTCPISLPLES